MSGSLAGCGGSLPQTEEFTVLIDCDSCAMRGLACGDCVVTMLLGSPSETGTSIDLDDAERMAVDLLAAGGLVSPLRLVPVTVRHEHPPSNRCIA